MKDPRHALDYDDRGARAVRSVLLELGQVLGTYRDRFVVIGGAVPWILLPDADPPHVGTLDVDLSLDAEALVEQEYTLLVQALVDAGYRRGEDGLKAFQLRRSVPVDGGNPIAVIVDLLMPREVVLEKNKPPLIAGFAVQRADGAAIAMRSYVEREFEGNMPDGRPNRVALRIASIPALLVMKGYALVGRDKYKDAYDIYFSVREYPGGPKVLAQDCRPLLADPIASRGFRHIAGRFTSPAAFGPETVLRFLRESPAAAGMTDDQVRMDVHGQVSTWLTALGVVADASA
jgi:hypothetical protein